MGFTRDTFQTINELDIQGIKNIKKIYLVYFESLNSTSK